MPSDTDDSWAEFYREIGLEPEPTEAAAAPAVEPIEEEEAAAEVEETEAEGEYEDKGAEADGPGGEEELNEDGTKKRRRRRRRRSKKSGVAGEPAAEGEAVESEVEEPLAEVYDDDGGPSPEASRELIANWDVPSWTEIVAGLHRPSGR